jgi:hypothetical protein
MNDERLRALYAGAMQRLPAPDAVEPVALEAMVDVLERNGSEAERSSTLRAILRDPRAREEFELLRAVHRAGAEPRSRWSAAVLWKIAAAVVIMTGTAWLFTVKQVDEERLRGGVATITTVEPADGVELAAPPLFVWHQVPGAVDYRIEVVDSSGAVVFEETVNDTVSTGPVSRGLVPGNRYRWSVTVLTKGAQSIRSAIRSFTLRAP